MKNKIRLLLVVALIFGLLILTNPINAINEDGYIVDISGINFKIPNSFSQDSEPLFDEDNIDIGGNNVHIYGVRFISDGNGVITISTSTRYGEPFDIEDGLEAQGVERTIAGKRGKYYEAESRFCYVDNGVSIIIQAPNLEMIEYCINTTNQ